MSEHEERLTDHEYDGIREYDNPMPPWWKNLFWATFVFSIGYFLYYELGNGPNAQDEYVAEVKAYQQLQAKLALANPEVSEDALAALMGDAAVVEEGKLKYAAVCAACHGQKGEGLIGPNLTDEFWIHGDGSLTGVMKVVKEGVLEKGMPAWERQLKPDELRKVVSFVGTLRGTKVPGKEPQGEKRPELAQEPGTSAR